MGAEAHKPDIQPVWVRHGFECDMTQNSTTRESKRDIDRWLWNGEG